MMLLLKKKKKGRKSLISVRRKTRVICNNLVRELKLEDGEEHKKSLTRSLPKGFQKQGLLSI